MPHKYKTLLLVSLVLIILLISSVVIVQNVLTMSLVKEIINVNSVITSDSHLGLLSNVKRTAQSLFPPYSSMLKISEVVSSSTRGNMSLFSTIENEVASKLFLVFTSLHKLSQISYIGENGFLYSFYSRGNQTFVVFSNTSISSYGTTLNVPPLYHWYSHEVYDSGLKNGETISLTPLNLVNSTWFCETLKSNNGYTSWEMGWSDDQDPLFLYSAPMSHSLNQGQRGILSFGFSIEDVINHMKKIDLHNAYYYMFTEDGHSIAQFGIPYTIVTFTNGTISIHLAKNENMKSVGPFVNISCKFEEFSSNNLTLGSTKYQVYCATLDILDLSSVYLFLFQRDGRQQQNRAFIPLTVISIIGLGASTIIFVLLIHEARKNEIYLQAALIRQKDATHQAERKSMNKSNAFASATHDIRASLASIVALIELCHSKVPSRSDLRENFVQMNTYAQNLLGILNTVLDTSKIEAGKMQLDEEDFDLTQVFEEIIDMFYVVGMRKGLEVIWDPCDGSIFKQPFVKGDCKRIKQVMINLLSNAVKFTTNGHVVVRVWSKKPTTRSYDCSSNPRKKCLDWIIGIPCLGHIYKYDISTRQKINDDQKCVEIVVEVDDTGMGISREKRSSVFENFVQVKEANNGAHEGTGLGLGIVQSLVRLMGGEIDIIDKDYGECGTCFRFNIFLTCQNSGDEIAKPIQTDTDLHALRTHSHHSSTPSSFRCGASKVPKQETIHAILWIQGEEERKIVQKWMEDKGIKVWSISHLSDLIFTLEKLKKFLSQFSASGKSDSTIVSDLSNSPPFAFIEEEQEGEPSGKDRLDNSLTFVAREFRRITSSKYSPSYLLVLIDMACEPFRDTCKVLVNFSRSMEDSRVKVVWLVDQNRGGFSSSSFHKQAPCDLVLPKPLHGSRLNKVSRLLQEFRGISSTQSHKTSFDILEEGHQHVQSLHSADIVSSHEIIVRSESLSNEKINFESRTTKEPLRGIKVLVVDDNPVLRMYHMRTLTSQGATVNGVENGEEALRLVLLALHESSEKDYKEFLYDIILMDCQMPVMDGFEATRRIRREEEKFGHYIPILAVTAHTSGEEVQKCFEAGVDGHIVKPIKKDKLTEHVLDIISHK